MSLLVTWTLVVGCVALTLPPARSDGNIGCLFSPSLCDQDVEWCYNDDAFGRCLQQNVDDEDLYRHELSPDELQELEREMERLLNMGYRWSHSYTQCLLQAMLYAYKIRTLYEPEVCDSLKDQDLSAALKAFESDEMAMSPQDLAYVKFTPSMNDPHADFADEVYFPPAPLDGDFIPVPPADLPEPEEDYVSDEDEERGPDLEDMEQVEVDSDYPNVGFSQRQFPFSLVRKKSLPQRHSPHFSHMYNTPDDFRRGYESKDLSPDLVIEPSSLSEGYNFADRLPVGNMMLPAQQENADVTDLSESILLPMLKAIGDSYPSPREALQSEGEVARGYTEGGLVLLPDKHEDADHSLSDFLVGLNSDINWGFKRPERLDVKKPGPPFKTNSYAFKTETDEKTHSSKQAENQKDHADCSGEKHGEPHSTETNSLPHTHVQLQKVEEELIMSPPLKKTQAPTNIDIAGSEHETGIGSFVSIKFKEPILSWIEGSYIVREVARLLRVPQSTFSDIRVNRSKVTFQVLPNDDNLNASTVIRRIEDMKDALKKNLDVTVVSANIIDENVLTPSIISLPQKKTLNPSEIDMEGSDQYDIVNNNIAFIRFKEILNTWVEGKHIIEEVARLLHVPASTFGEIRVDRNEVTFRVLSNSKNLNASTVAKRIENIKYVLKKDLGLTVTSAGIGDKTKLPSVLSLTNDQDNEFLVVAFIVSVVFITVVLSTILVFFVRRYAASRAKLRNLTTPDTEASKDYQELCRARMAAKPPHEATGPTAASHRIASLSRESDNSPSSRSSTSSWSEEPALSSMDISTGHMVLSYMEDHLRNKDRLETEWAALCAYEAEPCAAIIAQRPENAKKNRYVNALPYDHARVVLNELSNISSSDYINASTITDHDPRNPAYIATQGPLPHTAPDLWQMVWEQGCVVMVMLTRLIENDVAMCHRYWPEEGSELYHIYEVHLVSEHFWCDDYLVRSFYLKNLKTTETRTVTQFHFLSWPEGGVPSSTKALLEFRRKVNKSFRGRSCPIVVHCSDGVGRTGTYCLLDMVLNRMAKGAKEIDIAATLEHIRDQRAGCVATKQQFQFVLAAVAEEVQAILRVLPQQKAEPTPTTQPSSQ